jgi:hypothetical protein
LDLRTPPSQWVFRTAIAPPLCHWTILHIAAEPLPAGPLGPPPPPVEAEAEGKAPAVKAVRAMTRLAANGVRALVPAPLPATSSKATAAQRLPSAPDGATGAVVGLLHAVDDPRGRVVTFAMELFDPPTATAPAAGTGAGAAADAKGIDGGGGGGAGASAVVVEPVLRLTEWNAFGWSVVRDPSCIAVGPRPVSGSGSARLYVADLIPAKYGAIRDTARIQTFVDGRVVGAFGPIVDVAALCVSGQRLFALSWISYSVAVFDIGAADGGRRVATVTSPFNVGKWMTVPRSGAPPEFKWEHPRSITVLDGGNTLAVADAGALLDKSVVHFLPLQQQQQQQQ